MKHPRFVHGIYMVAAAALVFIGPADAQTSSPVKGSATPPAPPPGATVIRGQPKNLPPPPTPKPLPPDAKPSAEVLEKIRSAKPTPEALARQNAAHPIVPKKPKVTVKAASLGLSRLGGKTKKGGPSPLDAGAFEIDPLEVPAGAPGVRKGQQGHVTFLALDPGAEWARPLRGGAHDVTFVSLNLHASVATVVQIGGAWLSVLPSERDAGRLEVVVGAPDESGGIKWGKPIIETRAETFGGKQMAALPILTIRLDPSAGTWDLYSGLRLLALGRPIVSPAKGKAADRTMIVHAGSAGAWLNAVALSDKDPLFTDENNNGIDDAYEIDRRGALLSSNASGAERHALAAEWLKSRARQHLPPVPARRPLPDRLVEQSRP